MDNRPLRVKALEAAIKEITLSPTRERANKAYKRWEVFHKDPQFIQAVRDKQAKFSKAKK